jgi:hypothetical protein
MVRNALAYLVAQDAAQGLQVGGLEDVTRTRNEQNT